MSCTTWSGSGSPGTGWTAQVEIWCRCYRCCDAEGDRRRDAVATCRNAANNCYNAGTTYSNCASTYSSWASSCESTRSTKQSESINYANWASERQTTANNCQSCRDVAWNWYSTYNSYYIYKQAYENLSPFDPIIAGNGYVTNVCKWSCLYNCLVWKVDNSLTHVKVNETYLFSNSSSVGITNYNSSYGTYSNILKNR